MRRLTILLLTGTLFCPAQVYSPTAVKQGQPDASSLESLVQGIYATSSAVTPREKAEAIWRFFLTDGRFVKPGLWYHIAGWAYEEPKGEVLDPVKLLNSYGFGLCYHIAPLLEAVFEAGGFADARVWFLTGHTVAEVFYDGGYHYFDSDMLGYNPVGTGPVKQRRVASVHDIEKDGRIITGKLVGPKEVDAKNVDSPWYPADVRANAIPDLAGLFTSTRDNWVFPFTRYSSGHSMDFTLRPGERIIRFYHPADDRAYYLPFVDDDGRSREFPVEIARYQIRTANGPQSQKDSRRWGSGLIEYRPPQIPAGEFVIDMPSPWAIIDAAFKMNADISEGGQLTIETSIDGGRTWQPGASLSGPHHGPWTAEPAILTQTGNGRRTSVSGTYGYKVRIRQTHAKLADLLLTTRFQVNPRTLPELTNGTNTIHYRSSTKLRTEIPVRADAYERFAFKAADIEYHKESGQGDVRNVGTKPGHVIFKVEADDGGPLSSVDAGGRFLDLSDGLAPDKLTAEVRKVKPWPETGSAQSSASLSWSLKPEGPWTPLWTWPAKLTWKDGEVIDRTLRWPEVQRSVDSLPPGTRAVYVRYEFNGIAIDDFRLAWTQAGLRSASPLKITHIWKQDAAERRFSQTIAAGEAARDYTISIPENVSVSNEAIVFETYWAGSPP